MRIAEISTLLGPVPPTGSASVESLVSTITEGLVAKGHEVTLFALEGSKTGASLRSPVAVSYAVDGSKWDWQLYEAFQVREAFRAWREFDVIHCHSYYHGLLFCDLVATPSLHTIHIEPGPDYVFLARETANRHLHFCSQYQARDFQGIANVHVIPHGIAMDEFSVSPREERDDYVAFLGRFIPEKGPVQAIEIARQAGLPLKMAGAENDYFRDVVNPRIDGRQIEYVGELIGSERAALLSKARALIYPVQRGEPFGMVLIEAMAAGLPVVALNRGAVSEIVTHGCTGWIGNSEQDLIEGLLQVETFDRCAIRLHAETRFSAQRMVDSLELLLADIVKGSNA